MVKFSIRFFLLTLSSIASFGQPVVNSVLNAASYLQPGLPNAGIAQGSMVAVFGTGLGPSTLVRAATPALPTAGGLAGTSARITAGGKTADATLLYSSQSQLGIIVPSDTAPGTAQLVVTYAGVAGKPFSFEMVKSAFGIFTAAQDGSGPAIVQNVNSATDTPANSLYNSLRPGQLATIWGTGLGPVSGNEFAGPLPGAQPVDIEVTVGGKPALVKYQGRSGCCAGLDQIQFVVPEGISGCFVPLLVQIGGVVSNWTSISIAPEGGNCSDEYGFSSADISKAAGSGMFRYGSLTLQRFYIPFFVDIVTADSGEGVFTQYTFQRLNHFDRADRIPNGTCLVRTLLPFSMGIGIPTEQTASSFAASAGARLPSAAGEQAAIDAGEFITVNGPKGTMRLETLEDRSLYYGRLIVDQEADPPVNYLDPGAYTMDNGNGGTKAPSAGRFRVAMPVPPENLIWTNHDSIMSVVRKAGQEVTWSGANAGERVTIAGTSIDPDTGMGARFDCIEAGARGKFTVPPVVLLSLPVSAKDTSEPNGYYVHLTVGTQGPGVRFTASGLDLGTANYNFSRLKLLTYQ
jgi:uncharacterized protein (TIGR03437 family)